MLTRLDRRIGSQCFEQFSRPLHVEAGHLRNGFLPSIANALNAAEFLNEPASFDGPDSGNLEQLGGHGSHGSPLSIVGDGEPVRLVAQLLKHSESG